MGMMPTSEQKQHVDLFRKVMIRRRILREALPGPVYVPFCGDGDIAKELYADRQVYAADLDAGRTCNLQSTIPAAVVRTADCDVWPFADLDPPAFAVWILMPIPTLTRHSGHFGNQRPRGKSWLCSSPMDTGKGSFAPSG